MDIDAELMKKAQAKYTTVLDDASGYQLVDIKEVKKDDGTSFKVVVVWDKKTTGLNLEFYEREITAIDIDKSSVTVKTSALPSAMKRAEDYAKKRK